MSTSVVMDKYDEVDHWIVFEATVGTESMNLSRTTWEDLGCPEHISVKYVPGRDLSKLMSGRP